MFPVAHIAAPLLILAIYDKYLKAKHDLVSASQTEIPSLYYIIIGAAGILPDLLGAHLFASGRATLSHTLFAPLFLLAVYISLRKIRSKYSPYAALLLTGVSVHLVLDAATAPLVLLHPFTDWELESFVLFPGHVISEGGELYVNLREHATWYAADLFFFIGFVLVEKTEVIERIYRLRG